MPRLQIPKPMKKTDPSRRELEIMRTHSYFTIETECMTTNEIIETAKSQEGRKATPQYQDEIGQGEGVPQNKAQENEGNSNQAEMIRNVDEW